MAFDLQHGFGRVGFARLYFTVGSVAGFALMLTSAASGQATSSAARDWSGNYDFGGPAYQSIRQNRADLIKREESGYYDRLGKTSYRIYNDNSTRIRTQSNSTGSINNSETNVEYNGDGNSFQGHNEAGNNGCVDGHIDISEGIETNDGGVTCQ